MKRLGVIAASLIAAASLVQCTGSGSSDSGGSPDERPAPSASSPRPGEDLVERVAGFTAGFGPGHGYRRPTRTEREAVADGVALLLDHRRDQAEHRLANVDFEVRTVTDAVTGRHYAEVADRSEEAAAPRGWGRVYVDLDAPVRWMAQVPHPVADQNTERLGADLLRRSPGGVLIIAGAHRKAGRGDQADVAHRRDSVFHALSQTLTKRGLPGIQLHGMADDSAPRHDVVASTGRGREAVAEGRELADALRERGYDVCRAWARRCPLAGTSNVQGRLAAVRDVPFLHVEFGPRFRNHPKDARRAVEAMTTVTRTWQQQRRH